MANYLDSEAKIVELVQDIDTSKICLFTQSDNEELLIVSIQNDDEWNFWIDSSGKSDPPPDYFNPKTKIMMDVMRVDDHAYLDDKGRVVNPTNMRESELQKEIRSSGILDALSNVKDVIAIPHTDLSTDEDHNYEFYISNFERVVMGHGKKISKYQINHPGFKTAFLICDESTPYAETDSRHGNIIAGYPHFWFADKRFVDVLAACGADYVIWFAPFKEGVRALDDSYPEMPQICVYEIAHIHEHESLLQKYANSRMSSLEE